MTHAKTSTLAMAACGLIALCTGGGVLLGKLSNDESAATSTLPPKNLNDEGILAIPPSHAPQSPVANVSPADKIAALLEEAVQLLESSPPKSVEPEVRSIVGNLAESDIGEALAFAKDVSLDDEAAGLLRDEIYRRWGEIAGEEALATALTLKDDEERKRVVRKVVNGWAEADPEEAFVWYGENKAAAENAIGERTSQSLIGGIAKGWVRNDLDGGFELLAGLDYDLQTVAVREVGDLGREPAMRKRLAPRIESLAQGTLRSELIKEFGSEWAKSEPREAAAWFDAFTFESPTDRFTAANDIAEHFFEKHPREAVDWIYPKLPDDVKPQLVKQIVAGQWAERDRESAAKWLNDNGFDPNTLLP